MRRRGVERDGVLLACASSDVPRLFADDVLTCCARCGTSIYHRPGALCELGPGARAACLPCAARHEQAGGAQALKRVGVPGPHRLIAPRLTPRTAGITRRTLDEAARYLAEQPR